MPRQSNAAKALTINWSGYTDFLDSAGVPLSQGNAGINQDGALIQLGYFTESTLGNLFAGVWTPLTYGTSIGDSADLSGLGDGQSEFTFIFKEGSNFVWVYDKSDGYYLTEAAHSIFTDLPVSGTYLAMRFYDGTLGTATRYNTISSPDWQWTEINDSIFGNRLQFSEDATDASNNVQFEDPANPYITSLSLDSWNYGTISTESWQYLFWFGYYFQDAGSSWIFHMDHGWIYPSASTPSDIWIYDSVLGWIWTNADMYPFFFSKNEGDWLWFNSASQDREFYHYSNQSWQTHGLSGG